jgi:hypothetical protein
MRFRIAFRLRSTPDNSATGVQAGERFQDWGRISNGTVTILSRLSFAERKPRQPTTHLGRDEFEYAR